MKTLYLGIDASKMKQGAQEATTATNQVAVGATNAANSVQGLGSSMEKTAQRSVSASSIIKTAFAGVALKSAFDDFATFDKTLKTIEVITGTTGDALKQVEARAREMGATTVFSANAAAKSMLELARAGQSAAQASQTVAAAGNLANVGGTTLEAAAETISVTLAQYRLGVEQAARVSDVLSTAANSTQASVSGLAESMKYAGPFAGALGISLETTAAAIGVLSQAGLQGSDAGTNLRGVLVSLLNPTTEAEETFRSLGIATSEVSLKNVSLAQALKALRDAGAGPAELEKIFGRLNVTAGVALSKMVGDMEALDQKLRASKGSAEEASKALGGTLTSGLSGLNNEIEALKLNFGDTFGSTIKTSIGFLSDVLKVLSGTSGEFRTSEGAARALTGAVTGLTVAFVANKAVNLAQALISYVASARQAMLAVDALGVATARTTIAQRALNLAMAANPWTLLATGVGIAVGAMVAFRDETEQAKKATESLPDRLNDIASSAKTAAAELARAFDVGDQAKVEEALRNRISLMEQYSVAVRDGTKSTREALESVTSRSAVSGALFEIPTRSKWEVPTQGRNPSSQEAVSIIEAEIRSTKELLESMGAAKKQRDIVSDAITSQRDKLSQLIGDAQSELDILKISSRDREIEAAVRKSTAQATHLEAIEVDALANVLRGLLTQKRDIIAAEAEQRRALEESVAAWSDEIEAGQNAADAAGQFLESLREETNLLALSSEQREEATKLRDAERIALDLATESAQDWLAIVKEEIALQSEIKAEVSVWESWSKAIDENAKARQEIEAQRLDQIIRDEAKALEESFDFWDGVIRSMEEARAATGKMIDDLEFERSILDLNSDERERAIGLRQLEAQAAGLSADEIQDLAKTYSDTLEEIQQRQKKLKLAEDIADALVSPLEDAVFRSRSLADTLKNIYQSLAQIGFRTFFSGPLQSGLTSVFSSILPSANGNAFSAGNVIPFASGGVFDSPRFFPMAGGKTGLLGESGPEAILPLSRGSDGKLGVRSEGGGTVVNMTVYAKDADSFRRSKRQIAGDLRRGFS